MNVTEIPRENEFGDIFRPILDHLEAQESHGLLDVKSLIANILAHLVWSEVIGHDDLYNLLGSRKPQKKE